MKWKELKAHFSWRGIVPPFGSTKKVPNRMKKDKLR